MLSFNFYIYTHKKNKIMKTYTVTLDSKKAKLYINTLESVTVAAENKKDAVAKGRRIARYEGMKFVGCRLSHK